MTGLLVLFILTIWCSYVTSIVDKHSKELESDIKTGVTTSIPAARNWLTVSTTIPLENYCTISECKIITCNPMSPFDSGQVASTFLTTVFKDQCPTKTSISSLIFINAHFPNNKLKKFWLTSIIPIDCIKFDSCEINKIDRDAFSMSIFNSTKSLSIINTKTIILNKYLFDELNNLHNFVVQNSLIITVEQNLLNNVAEILETIELDKSIEDMQVLLNITDGVKLSKVQLLSLQGNNIPNLTYAILRAFPNVISIYMDSSRINFIHKDAFKSCRKIKQIFMNNNKLTTLPQGIFDSLAIYSPEFKLTISNNPWNCDCNLRWIQDMMIKMPAMLMKIPKCTQPDENINKTFLNAKFCYDENDKITTSILGTTTTVITNTPLMPINNSTQSSSSRSASLIKISCYILTSTSPFLQHNTRRKLLSSTDYEFTSKPMGFSVEKLNNGSIIVNLNSKNYGSSLLWFKSDNVTNNIRCIKNINHNIMLNNLQFNSSYTICLLEKFKIKFISPFNCLSIQTLSSKNSRIWLFNDDKTLVLSIYTIITFFFTLLGAGCCFFIVKKNPSLLKGSKRVILVKRGQVKALVLPKGMDNHLVQRGCDKRGGKLDDFKIPQVDYLMPVKMQHNNNNKMLCSSNSYESIDNRQFNKNIETKMSGLLSPTLSRESDIPPPLPPHPLHGVIPSVSLLMDSEHKITGGKSEIQDDTEIYSCIQLK